jgi:hypothetical protein
MGESDFSGPYIDPVERRRQACLFVFAPAKNPEFSVASSIDPEVNQSPRFSRNIGKSQCTRRIGHQLLTDWTETTEIDTRIRRQRFVDRPRYTKESFDNFTAAASAGDIILSLAQGFQNVHHLLGRQSNA